MNRSGVAGRGWRRAAAPNEPASSWLAAFMSCAMFAKKVPHSPASPSSIQRRIRSAIGESGGVSDATAARTRRSTSSGWSTVNHRLIRPPPDSASIATGPMLSSRRTVATPSAMTRGCMIRSASAESSGMGRPMTVTRRARERPSHRRCSNCSVPASGRIPLSTPPSTTSGVPSPPSSSNASMRPPGMASACVLIGAHAARTPRATIGQWPQSAAPTLSTSPTSRACT